MRQRLKVYKTLLFSYLSSNLQAEDKLFAWEVGNMDKNYWYRFLISKDEEQKDLQKYKPDMSAILRRKLFTITHTGMNDHLHFDEVHTEDTSFRKFVHETKE